MFDTVEGTYVQKKPAQVLIRRLMSDIKSAFNLIYSQIGPIRAQLDSTSHIGDKTCLYGKEI